ncbi:MULTISPECIES: hypothetical protein [unclassified Pseudomonas]|uniref:hypothetical protein n=1 Tax=unclassified Pseudomonas TaxID=196821 RepID=UPI001BCB11EA|nr:hypothetical protein [Pseudomonas sp. Pc102]BBP85655.1 hypothetical protein PHLH8_52970 [Pseudomonas sp. Pc102]
MLEWNALNPRQRVSVLCLLGFALTYALITLPFIAALESTSMMVRGLCEWLAIIALFSAIALDPMFVRGQLLQLRPRRFPFFCKCLWVAVILLFGLGNLMRIAAS